MRQMVLGAVVAFALTVIVLSFWTPKSQPAAPTVVDAGHVAVVADGGHSIPTKPFAVMPNRTFPMTRIRQFQPPNVAPLTVPAAIPADAGG